MIIKNSNIRQYLSHNRYFILFGIIGIILLLLILGNLSDIERKKQQKEEEESNKQNQVTVNKNNTYKPNETVISGQNVSQEKQEQNENVIDQFIQYCNQKQIQKAYDLLTQSCKEELYPNVDSFQTSYVEQRFQIPRQYSMQSWYADGVYTYKIILTDDMLATGNAQLTNSLEEYYTISNENGQAKLNVNNYIGKKGINKQASKNGITIQVKSKAMYKDYEIYTVQVHNQTGNKILLTDKNNTNEVYLQGKNGGTYRGLTYELSETDLLVNPGNNKEIKIKFNKVYNPSLRITIMTFADIILNYEEYSQTENKQNYEKIMNMQIEM